VVGLDEMQVCLLEPLPAGEGGMLGYGAEDEVSENGV
jgi:hypothetical protein